MSNQDRLVTTEELWPRLAECFGLDPTAKYITKFELVLERPLPIVRIEFLVSTGNIMPLENILVEYELNRKLGAGETAQPEMEVA